MPLLYSGVCSERTSAGPVGWPDATLRYLHGVCRSPLDRNGPLRVNRWAGRMSIHDPLPRQSICGSDSTVRTEWWLCGASDRAQKIAGPAVEVHDEPMAAQSLHPYTQVLDRVERAT